MNRIRRYWTLWRTLPDDERRARAARVAERVLRRRPAIRRLGLAPDPPRPARFARALSVEPAELAARLARRDPRRGPLFEELEGRAAAIAERCPEHVQSVLEAAGRILQGRFDLLGSGECSLARGDGGIDWHRDWKSGRSWPEETYHTDLDTVRGDGSDVKLPWELSRCQHLLVLGQAYRLAIHALESDQAASLRQRVAATAREHLDDWIRTNPRGLGVNWSCTMEVAMRASTWLASLGLFRGSEAFDSGFLLRIGCSLWSHGRHIRGNLEIGADGLTTNHYLAGVSGLYAIACGVPELREAAAWESFARSALEEQLERQVHADGVGFERSLPYHRLVAEMLVHAALLGRSRGQEFPAPWLARLGRMLEFSASATRGDHTVPQWGDNDDGRLLPLHGYAGRRPHDQRHLLALGGRVLERNDLIVAGRGAEAEALWLVGPAAREASGAAAGRESRGFPDAGYFVMRQGDLHCAIPAGAVGTRGLGNHSHNDLLSLCVWAGGIEWIADPGSGSYTGDPALRNRLRATAAHATLQLGSREQNEPGAGLDGLFVVRERAHPLVGEWRADARGAHLKARHFGFSAGDERWVHERTVRFEPGQRAWFVRDELIRESGEAPLTEAVHVRFPLRPEVSATIGAALPETLGRLADQNAADGPAPRARSAVRLAAGDTRSFWIAVDAPAGSSVTIERASYSPRYGVVEPTAVLTATAPPAARTVVHATLWSPAGEP